jgi:hypothetical protein
LLVVFFDEAKAEQELDSRFRGNDERERKALDSRQKHAGMTSGRR